MCSVYSEDNAFYLVSFPTSKTVYCVDMKQAMEDGSARITVWYPFEATAFLRKRSRDVLIGKADGIGLYTGYTDNGAAYRLRYLSHYTDFGSPSVLKVLKQIKVTVFGGVNQQINIQTAVDYSTNFNTYVFTISGQVPTEYGVGEYGVGEYTLGVSTDKIASSVGGTGNVIQFGFEAAISGQELSVQTLDAFVKTGRTN
jgi:hypothetical protein